MSLTPSPAQIRAAADLADGFIAEILDAEPSLLISKVADGDAKDIAKAARTLAEFRGHLIDALAVQPLGSADEDEEYEEGDDEEEDEDDEEADGELDAEAEDGKAA